MRQLAVLFQVCLLSLAGCALPSPYSAAEIPDLPEVEARQLSPDRVQFIAGQRLPPNCRRDAILLKATKVTLESGYTHFQIVGETSEQYAAIMEVNGSGSPTLISLCRGVCPGMFSADAIAHILVPKFNVASGLLFPGRKDFPECRSDLN